MLNFESVVFLLAVKGGAISEKKIKLKKKLHFHQKNGENALFFHIFHFLSLFKFTFQKGKPRLREQILRWTEINCRNWIRRDWAGQKYKWILICNLSTSPNIFPQALATYPTNREPQVTCWGILVTHRHSPALGKVHSHTLLPPSLSARSWRRRAWHPTR